MTKSNDDAEMEEVMQMVLELLRSASIWTGGEMKITRASPTQVEVITRPGKPWTKRYVLTLAEMGQPVSSMKFGSFKRGIREAAAVTAADGHAGWCGYRLSVESGKPDLRRCTCPVRDRKRAGRRKPPISRLRKPAGGSRAIRKPGKGS